MALFFLSHRKENKTQFVAELRSKYTNLCGEIQPVPFLREKYDIDKLFVESGIKFFDEEQRSCDTNETWTTSLLTLESNQRGPL